MLLSAAPEMKVSLLLQQDTAVTWCPPCFPPQFQFLVGSEHQDYYLWQQLQPSSFQQVSHPWSPIRFTYCMGAHTILPDPTAEPTRGCCSQSLATRYLEIALCQAGALLVKAVKGKFPGEANISRSSNSKVNSLGSELFLGQRCSPDFSSGACSSSCWTAPR